MKALNMKIPVWDEKIRRVSGQKRFQIFIYFTFTKLTKNTFWSW